MRKSSTRLELSLLFYPKS